MAGIVTEILDVAHYEIVALSPAVPGVSIEQELIFQELQSPQQCEDVKGHNYCGQSPKSDQGYESDPSCNQIGWDYPLTSEKPLSECEIAMAEELVSEFTYAEAQDASNTNSNYNAAPIGCGSSQLKMEPVNDYTQWTEPQTFTQALANTDLFNLADDPFLPPLSTASATYMTQQCDARDTTASDNNSRWSMSSAYSSDSSVYTPSTHESTSSMDELEISDSEDVECQVTWSPMPHHEPNNNASKKRRRKRTSKQPILWKFLLDALNKPETYGAMIQWVDKSRGTFQFTSNRKEELSQKWGEAKRNRCKMTYQKMARAMRNYINRQEVLQKVKKKLQYTFLPEFYSDIRHMVQ